jgi:hypothetical protein
MVMNLKFVRNVIIIIIIIIIKTILFNSYLRANLTGQRPITKFARIRRKKQQNTNKIQNKALIMAEVVVVPLKNQSYR